MNRPELMRDCILAMLQAFGPLTYEELAGLLNAPVGSVQTQNNHNRHVGYVEFKSRKGRMRITPEGEERLAVCREQRT